MKREVSRIVTAVATLEGGGFLVHRPFPIPGFDHFDPFLLLDEMGPSDYEPGEAIGAPSHPHRGFETVTYLLDGEMEHEDSHGNKGKLRPGDVQWMTAGAGVVHSELPSESFREHGGRMHGFQLWVNLPKADKMSPPRYQEIAASEIPRAEWDGVIARVIAGRVGDVASPVTTRIPILYLHLTLAPGARFEHEVESGQNGFAYTFKGSVQLGNAVIGTHQMAILGDGDAVAIENADEESEVLLISGAPIKEPMARYGPFVMNYRAEIVQAIDDFESGRF